MGFKKKEAEEAVVTVATEIEASGRTLQTFVDFALRTPSPSQRAARAAAAAPVRRCRSQTVTTFPTRSVMPSPSAMDTNVLF